MTRIDSYEDWWSAVDKNWKQLRLILVRFIPMNGNEGFAGQILPHPLWIEVENLKEAGNEDLARYFHAAYAAAPDSPEIHRIPGWGLLCDLCSEEGVLFDGEEIPNA